MTVLAYTWNFDWLPRAAPLFFNGTLLTLRILIVAAVLAIALGLVLGELLTSHSRWVRALPRAYVDFFRLTPILLHIVLVFFLLPIVFGLRLSALTSGIIALALNYAAFFAEVFRAGVTSLDRGQREAAQAMGMRRFAVLRRVIYPQAIRRMLPPLGGMLVSLTKDTSLVSVIGVAELFNVAQAVGAQTFKQTEVLLTISVIYLVVNYPLANAAERLHRRLIVNA
ncbi:MAG: amino acid ABC transporter permease [Chloroflexota bacterium]|nr:amino acid ABC transporter permease [Chloroflexota bacterium]